MAGKWPDSPETRSYLKEQARLTRTTNNLIVALIAGAAVMCVCICTGVGVFMLVTGTTFAALISAFAQAAP